MDRSAWRADRRANLLNAFQVTLEDSTGHRLLLHAAQDIVDVLVALDGPAYSQRHLSDGDWTHELMSPSPMSSSVSQLLQLLSRILTMHRPKYLNLAHALSWYKQATESGILLNTEVGDLISRAKYRWADPREIIQCGKQLTDALVVLIQQHPLLSTADVVISVPGHDRDLVAFSQRLGSSVAARLSIQHVKVDTTNAQRPEAKAMTPEQRRQLAEEFTIDRNLHGLCGIIIDDVYRSGDTMAGVARAARRAGARWLAGLVCARTIRAT